MITINNTSPPKQAQNTPSSHSSPFHPHQPTWEVPRALADLVGDVLEVKERAAAGGAADVLGLGVAHAHALRQAKGRLAEVGEFLSLIHI